MTYKSESTDKSENTECSDDAIQDWYDEKEEDAIQAWYDEQEEKGLGENYIAIAEIIFSNFSKLHDPKEFVSSVKFAAKKQSISLHHVFTLMRLALQGTLKGHSIEGLVDLLNTANITTLQRFENFFPWMLPGWDGPDFTKITIIDKVDPEGHK